MEAITDKNRVAIFAGQRRLSPERIPMVRHQLKGLTVVNLADSPFA